VKPILQTGQIWLDSRYYLNEETGEYMPKYLLILADRLDCADVISAVFTSKPNGLREHPACDHGPPRAGYFVGTPGAPLSLPTWVDFSSVRTHDELDVDSHVKGGRYKVVGQTLGNGVFCGLLRCICQSDDLTNRQRSWIQDIIAKLGCPH